MPGIPDHTQEKLHDQIVASMDILLHAKSKLSTSNSFWDIKIYKIMQSHWSRVFSITMSSRTRFFTAMSFYRFSKVVYHLKPKNHIDGPNLSSKYVLLIFSEHLGHPWLNPKNITWSNCNFHEHLTTFKKGTLYLKLFLWY